MTDHGFPAEAFDFYDGLAADNTKAYWQDHKELYATAVQAPFARLQAALGPQFGEGHLYRPYRDLRFTKDKRPYKDHQGMFVELRNGLGWYLQISAAGLMIAGGWYMSDAQQLKHFREAVGGTTTRTAAARASQAAPAVALRQWLASLTDEGFTVSGDRLKTRPRGVPADHPNLDLLRYKSIYVSQSWEPAEWMAGPQLVERVQSRWATLTPWLEWLADLVGPGVPPLGSRGGKGRTDRA